MKIMAAILLIFLLVGLVGVCVIVGTSHVALLEDTRPEAFRDCYEALQYLDDWYKRHDPDDTESRKVIRRMFDQLLELETEGGYKGEER